MGRQQFECERLQDGRGKETTVKEVKPKKKLGSEVPEPASGDENETWQSWLESPRAVENMRYFVFVQSFVMFLTFGLPQLQKAWSYVADMFN